jgi:hypothetical protein
MQGVGWRKRQLRAGVFGETIVAAREEASARVSGHVKAVQSDCKGVADATESQAAEMPAVRNAPAVDRDDLVAFAAFGFWLREVEGPHLQL